MTVEEELKLIDLLIRMGFGGEYILWAMYHVSEGCAIGYAMMKAVHDTTNVKKFPEGDEL